MLAHGKEPEHRSGDALGRPTVLLDDVVQVLDLANGDEGFPFGGEVVRAARLARLPSMVTESGSPLRSAAFSKKRTAAVLSRWARSAQHEVDDIADPIDRPRQILPLAAF